MISKHSAKILKCNIKSIADHEAEIDKGIRVAVIKGEKEFRRAFNVEDIADELQRRYMEGGWRCSVLHSQRDRAYDQSSSWTLTIYLEDL